MTSLEAFQGVILKQISQVSPDFSFSGNHAIANSANLSGSVCLKNQCREQILVLEPSTQTQSKECKRLSLSLFRVCEDRYKERKIGIDLPTKNEYSHRYSSYSDVK